MPAASDLRRQHVLGVADAIHSRVWRDRDHGVARLPFRHAAGAARGHRREKADQESAGGLRQQPLPCRQVTLMATSILK